MNNKFERAFEEFLESVEAEQCLDCVQTSLRHAFIQGYKMGLRDRTENDMKNNIEEARKELLQNK